MKTVHLSKQQMIEDEVDLDDIVDIERMIEDDEKVELRERQSREIEEHQIRFVRIFDF